MGEEAEESYFAGCSVSLMCQEDSADLDGVFVDGGELVLVCSDAEEAEEEEEYMSHLVSKESSFCCSPASSSDDDSGGDESSPLSMAAEDWFRGARRDTVQWILEVTHSLIELKHQSLPVSWSSASAL